MNLPSLHGYVKFPEGFPAARIRLNWTDYPAVAAPFQRKSDMQIAAYVAPQLDGDGEGDDGGSLPTTTSPEGSEPPTAKEFVNGIVPPQANSVADLAIQGILQFDQPIDPEVQTARRADDDAPAIAPNDDAWKTSLRQHRSGGRDPLERVKVQNEQQTGLKPSDAAKGAVKREQQITLEERTGQAFADPAERGARHNASPTHHDPSASIGPDGDMDMGM